MLSQWVVPTRAAYVPPAVLIELNVEMDMVNLSNARAPRRGEVEVPDKVETVQTRQTQGTTYVRNVPVSSLSGWFGDLSCYHTPRRQITQSIGNEERITSYLLNLTIVEIRSVSVVGRPLHQGSVNFFIELQRS